MNFCIIVLAHQIVFLSFAQDFYPISNTKTAAINKDQLLMFIQLGNQIITNWSSYILCSIKRQPARFPKYFFYFIQICIYTGNKTLKI